MAAILDLADTTATIDRLVAEASAALSAAGISSPRLDAELLLATVSGLNRTALYVRGREALSPRCTEQFRGLLRRRVGREPLQYIVGRQEFWSLEFLVTPNVLVPRPETELLVEGALSVIGCDGPSRRRQKRAAPQGEPTGALRLESNDSWTVRAEALEARSSQLAPSPPRQEAESRAEPLRVCDVGTGSGCIAIALAHELAQAQARALPDAEVWALDVSPRALAVAELNAQRLGVANRIHLGRSDLLAAVATQRFDVIVSNPPYLTVMDLANLQPEVAFEPRTALDGGADGLDIIRRLLATAPDHLVAGGWLLMEIGALQATAVVDLARASSFSDVSFRCDYAGLPRILVARC
jgi:release factor glutamine methyltransferase